MRHCVLRCSSEGQRRDCSMAQNQKEIFLLLACDDFKLKLDLIEGIVNTILKKGLGEENYEWWYK